VRVCDHGEAQQVRHALAVRLAVGGQGEHRLEQRLELQCGADLADELCDVVTGVPEPVRCAGRDGQTVSRSRDELLAPDAEADAAADDLEALLLRRVDVCGGDEAVRLHVGLDHHCFAAGFT
jgi:hypothetical protein